MPIIDTYRRNISRKGTELAKLQSDRANETKKSSPQINKIQSAKKSISRTKSASIMNSKLREIERAQKTLATIDKKVADIDAKIARKQKEISEEERKFRREEEHERKKKEREDKKRLQESERQMKKFNDTLVQQNRTQSRMQKELTGLQRLPEQITVLFMASNPMDSARLRLDEEVRAINEMIRKSKHRDSVKLETRWAVRPLDVLQAINELNPDVVHFSGHGSDKDEIILQNADGTARFVSKEAIVQTMMTSSEKIRLVFFNACFSHGQAQAIVEHVEAAIGMVESIGDDAARVFAAQFYSAISFGLSVQKAFNQAKAALMLEGIPEEDIPELSIKQGLDPDEIIIVKP